MIKQILFNICKAPFMGKFIGIVFQYFSWAIPVKKVYNSKDVIAFYHPKPSYKNHIIILPKRAITNLQQMAMEGLDEYFAKIWEAVWDICAFYPEYQDSFVLVANGGKRQEVKQMHFHMFTNHEVVNEDWEIHMVIPTVSEPQISKEYFKNIMLNVNLMNEKFEILQSGYSLVYQYNKQENDMGSPVFHIISGKKLNN